MSNRDYAYRVTYTYFMQDGVACAPSDKAVEYTFSVKPYAPRYFKTCNNASRTLVREGFTKIPAYKGPRFFKMHKTTGNNPATGEFPVYATIT